MKRKWLKKPWEDHSFLTWTWSCSPQNFQKIVLYYGSEYNKLQNHIFKNNVGDSFSRYTLFENMAIKSGTDVKWRVPTISLNGQIMISPREVSERFKFLKKSDYERETWWFYCCVCVCECGQCHSKLITHLLGRASAEPLRTLAYVYWKYWA